MVYLDEYVYGLSKIRFYCELVRMKQLNYSTPFGGSFPHRTSAKYERNFKKYKEKCPNDFL
jgi:hypothetical protein